MNLSQMTDDAITSSVKHMLRKVLLALTGISYIWLKFNNSKTGPMCACIAHWFSWCVVSTQPLRVVVGKCSMDAGVGICTAALQVPSREAGPR
ncbi:hypothetical protein J6590_103154 [Homalodisca vitripennis]|nr:hypothetical protein J6590_103154 [Homalodisca vitripennis]